MRENDEKKISRRSEKSLSKRRLALFYVRARGARNGRAVQYNAKKVQEVTLTTSSNITSRNNTSRASYLVTGCRTLTSPRGTKSRLVIGYKMHVPETRKKKRETLTRFKKVQKTERQKGTDMGRLERITQNEIKYRRNFTKNNRNNVKLKMADLLQMTSVATLFFGKHKSRGNKLRPVYFRSQYSRYEALIHEPQGSKALNWYSPTSEGNTTNVRYRVATPGVKSTTPDWELEDDDPVVDKSGWLVCGQGQQGWI